MIKWFLVGVVVMSLVVAVYPANVRCCYCDGSIQERAPWVLHLLLPSRCHAECFWSRHPMPPPPPLPDRYRQGAPS